MEIYEKNDAYNRLEGNKVFPEKTNGIYRLDEGIVFSEKTNDGYSRLEENKVSYNEVKPKENLYISNISNNKAIEKKINLQLTYIGIYETNGEYRIGLFQKGNVVATKIDSLSVQYYHDVLSDNTVALLLNPNGKDKKCDFSHPLFNDPEERKSWRGVRGVISPSDTIRYNIPNVTTEVDRHLGLVEFSSVFPQVKSNPNIINVIGYLVTYTSKLDLTSSAGSQILKGLLNVAKYFEDSKKNIPIFENIPVNEIDLEQSSSFGR